MYTRNYFGISSVQYVQWTYQEPVFYRQVTSRQISEKSNCTHTRNVKRGHRESSKGIKIRSRCCNIYLMHRYVYKQKQERRGSEGSEKNQKPLLLLHASLISSSTNQKPRTPPPPPHITLHIQPQGPTPSSSSSEK